MTFHCYDPTEKPHFVCVTCQRPAAFMFHTLFGIATLACLCERCGQAMCRRWPDAVPANEIEVRP